jgi:hypothetical protein
MDSHDYAVAVHVRASDKHKISDPLTLPGILDVESNFLRSIAVRIAPGSCRPATHAAGSCCTPQAID